MANRPFEIQNKPIAFKFPKLSKIRLLLFREAKSFDFPDIYSLRDAICMLQFVPSQTSISLTHSHVIRAVLSEVSIRLHRSLNYSGLAGLLQHICHTSCGTEQKDPPPEQKREIKGCLQISRQRRKWCYLIWNLALVCLCSSSVTHSPSQTNDIFNVLC